jgi:hypothetical protein
MEACRRSAHAAGIEPEMLIAAVHESSIGAKRKCRLCAAMSALVGKPANICSP